ncbi:MAG: hypothetical protein IKU97_04085 [Tidjanibacter sp.]|nr:hypothetical protein [Tidjanibacter sp.]
MTTQINALVARYIADSTRLIIPNIGTLLRRKESGEIVFMEMLKKGDGTLNALVGAHFQLSDAQAAEAVENYTAAIRKGLDTNKKFIMDGVGVLLVGTNGNIEFIFNPSAQTIDAVQPKEEPIVVMEVEEEVATEPSTAEPEVVEEPAIVELNTEDSVDTEPIAEPTEEVSTEPTEDAPKGSKLEALYDDEEDEPVADKVRKSIDFEAIKSKLNIKRRPAKKSSLHIKIDAITILAIVSGLIAIGTLIWGMIPNHAPLDIDTPIEIVEE